MVHPASDIIFAYIQLEDGLSFEIFDAVPMQTPFILTVNFRQYALKAFQLLSVDYLLKPIQAKDLAGRWESTPTGSPKPPRPSQTASPSY